jgi:hypothetical protein
VTEKDEKPNSCLNGKLGRVERQKNTRIVSTTTKNKLNWSSDASEGNNRSTQNTGADFIQQLRKNELRITTKIKNKYN